MAEDPQDGKDRAEAVRAALAGAPEPMLSSPRPVCPVCRGEIPEGRKSCRVGRCRAALSRRKRARALEDRDARLREALEAALRELNKPLDRCNH